MGKITPFVIQKIEEKLNLSITDKGACADLRRLLHNSDSEDGHFSLNTIKRWFGVIEKQVEPQPNGLEAIASYLGYPSWASLELEPGYANIPEKTEADYICDIYTDYKTILQSIEDYAFRKERAKTEQEIRQYKTKLDALKKRQNLIKDAIVELSNLLTDSSVYESDWEKIENLFRNQHYNEANNLLDEERLKEEQATLLRTLKKKEIEIAPVYEKLQRNSRCFYIKAQICRSNNQREEAKILYLSSLESYRSFATLFSLAGYYMEDRSYNEAQLLFEEIRKRAGELQKEPDSYKKSAMVNILIDSIYNLGQIAFYQKKYEDVIENMNLVLIFLGLLDHPNTASISMKVADVYNEIGDLFIETGDSNLGMAFLDKAMGIYKVHSLSDFIETGLNRVYAQIELGQFETVKETIENALAFYRNQHEEKEISTNDYRFTVGKIHFLDGYANYKQQKNEQAAISYKRALAYLEKLHEVAPTGEVKNEIANTLHNLNLVTKN